MRISSQSPRGHAHSTRLRAITPSPEKATGQRIARVPLLIGTPNKQLFPPTSQEAVPGEDRYVPNREYHGQLILIHVGASSKPNETASDIACTIAKAQRIEFVQFSLVEDGASRLPSDLEHEQLLNAFPSAMSVGVFCSTVVVCFVTLPPKPWPLSVAGLPVVFTTNKHNVGLNHGKLGGSHTRGLAYLDSRKKFPESVLDEVIIYFEKQLLIAVTSVTSLAGVWVITVPDGTDLLSLPTIIAQSPCYYKFASQAENLEEAACRNTESAGTTWDHSQYSMVQPGIMLGSGGELNELLTTSGIIVKDNDGHNYLTVASHGFPAGRDNVYHPNVNGSRLGRIHDRLINTDIALLRLSPSQHFDNITFGARFSDGTTEPPLQICGIKSTFAMQSYELVSINNPFNGFCEGLFMGSGKYRLPADGPVANHKWVSTVWVYYGNGRAEPMKGSSGSPILDKDGFLIGFFRYLTPSGLAVGIGASTLETWGYSVV